MEGEEGKWEDEKAVRCSSGRQVWDDKYFNLGQRKRKTKISYKALQPFIALHIFSSVNLIHSEECLSTLILNVDITHVTKCLVF